MLNLLLCSNKALDIAAICISIGALLIAGLALLLNFVRGRPKIEIEIDERSLPEAPIHRFYSSEKQNIAFVKMLVKNMRNVSATILGFEITVGKKTFQDLNNYTKNTNYFDLDDPGLKEAEIPNEYIEFATRPPLTLQPNVAQEFVAFFPDFITAHSDQIEACLKIVINQQKPIYKKIYLFKKDIIKATYDII